MRTDALTVVQHEVAGMLVYNSAKRVSNCYIPPKKFARVCVCACVRIILVLVWGTFCVPHTYVPGIRTYVPGISPLPRYALLKLRIYEGGVCIMYDIRTMLLRFSSGVPYGFRDRKRFELVPKIT